MAAAGLGAALYLQGCTTDAPVEGTRNFLRKSVDFISTPFSGDTEARTDAERSERTDAAEWDSIERSDNPDDFRRFIERHPESAFATLAKRRLEELEELGIDPPPQIGTKAFQTPPPPPKLPQTAKLPAAEAAGAFPAPWVLGRWAFDCNTAGASGGGVTYIQETANRVRIDRDDGSTASYSIRREGGQLVLDGGGLQYRDQIISITEIRSFAVRQDGTWHEVDLTYKKCSSVPPKTG